MTRDTLTAGTVIITVRPDLAFLTSRRLLGEEWHDEYKYKLERVGTDARFDLYLRTWSKNERYPDKCGRWVYTGAVHPWSGKVSLTTSSAFPETKKDGKICTRLAVARHVLEALFTGRDAEIAWHGWEVNVEVVEELAGRF